MRIGEVETGTRWADVRLLAVRAAVEPEDEGLGNA